MNSLIKISIMKNKFFIALLVLSVAACDKVKHPNEAPPPPLCTLNSPIIKTNSNNNFRKVLVEDYTGHTCGFCPRAARRAEGLVASNGDKVVVIANHVSETFAKPEFDTLYREDFRNEVSTAWDVFFNMSGSGLPKGGVNRSTSPYAQGDAAWPSLVATQLAKPQTAKLDITSMYDPIQHLLNVKVKTTFLQAFSEQIMISVLLTQDSIIGDQKDYVPPAGVVVEPPDVRPDYLFEHLVIGSMNGVWGQVVKKSPAVNDTATVSNECFLLEKCYFKNIVCTDDKHVNVVAFVYNNDTKEVLQVEKLKIR